MAQQALNRKPARLDTTEWRLQSIVRTYEEIRACVLSDPKGEFRVEVRTLEGVTDLHMLWDATFLGHRYVYATAVIEPFLDWNIENLSHMLRHALWSLQTIRSKAVLEGLL